MSVELPVTIADVEAEMRRLLTLLKQANDIDRVFEIETQLSTLELLKSAKILDPLTDINAATAVDLRKLGAAIDEAEKANQRIDARNEAIGKAMTIVRIALKAAGI